MTIGFQKVEPISKRVRVVATLKDAILAGGLKPGEQLVETKIAQQFGVGQGLIREALIELEHQGFVERTPFSGTHVTNLKLADTQQIFDIRLELEPLAYALAAQHASAAELAAIGELFKTMKQQLAGENLARFFEANLACRRKIWEASGNRFLAQALERLVAPLFALYVITEKHNHTTHLRVAQVSTAVQEKAVKALCARDAVAAGRLTRMFLQETKDKLHQLLTPERA
ncbi:MAG: GntR family transcriptional regulator [Acidobacteria bacterium]|nr:GntR family transcriptional regulator [Acidobacteriota bacterium]MBI3424059.1 GntR family transcriptional regulator [Acidobacteriota bacterium]